MRTFFYIKQSKIFIKSLKLRALPDFPAVLSIKLQIIITAPCFWELGGQSYFVEIKIEEKKLAKLRDHTRHINL